jgi:hypothetical protein
MLWILFRNKVYVFASLSSVFFLFGIIGRSICSLFSKFFRSAMTWEKSNIDEAGVTRYF